MKIKILYNYRIPLCLIMLSFLSLNSYADHTFVINDQTGCYKATENAGSQLRWVIDSSVNPGYRNVPHGGSLSYTYDSFSGVFQAVDSKMMLVVTPSNKVIAVYSFHNPSIGAAKLTLNSSSQKAYDLDLSKDGSTFTISVSKGSSNCVS